MSDLALVFINIDGHWIRVDQIESIHPAPETAITAADGNICYVKMIHGSVPRRYDCSPEHILQEMGKALRIARQESTPPPDLDDIAGDEPQPSGITETRGGSSWGRP